MKKNLNWKTKFKFYRINATDSVSSWIQAHTYLKKLKINAWALKKQCTNFIVFKYFYKQCPQYLNEVFVNALKSGLSLRNSYHKIKQQFRKTCICQSTLSFIGPALKLKVEIKRKTNLNTSKRNLRKTTWIRNSSFKKKILSLSLLLWLVSLIVLYN